MTKIYAQGNYMVIEANNERNTFPKRDVRFKVVDEDGIYSLSSQELPIGDFNYSEVKKEDGSDYTTALEFETFLFENTGNFNLGADGSPNSNNYSVDEIQVGKFIYINDNGDKVSKPKYRKVFKSTLGTNINPNTSWQTDGFGIIQLPESIDNIINISAEFDLWSKNIGFGLSVFRNALISPVREVIKHVNIGYSLSESGNEIYIDGFVKTLDEALTPSETTTYHLPNDIVYNLHIEYTKTSDTETIIEPAI